LNARRIVSAALVGLLGAPLSGAPGQEALSPESRWVERGKALYQVYCTGCHGESLAGDGSAARGLETRPSDLTRIAIRHGGEFPFPDVYRAIAGFDDTHVKRDMPGWGFAFQELDSDVNQQDQVRGRILQLVYYLESVQKDPKGRDDGDPE
jgi:mono/diheme cytochrome c family protein